MATCKSLVRLVGAEQRGRPPPPVVQVTVSCSPARRPPSASPVVRFSSSWLTWYCESTSPSSEMITPEPQGRDTRAGRASRAASRTRRSVARNEPKSEPGPAASAPGALVNEPTAWKGGGFLYVQLAGRPRRCGRWCWRRARGRRGSSWAAAAEGPAAHPLAVLLPVL